MLDVKVVRQDPVKVATALKRRGFDFDIARFEALDAERKAADVESQNLLAERKAASKKIGELIQGGMEFGTIVISYLQLVIVGLTILLLV